MSEKIKRNTINKIFLALYVIFVLVIPMISLFASFGIYEDLKAWDTFIGKATPILYALASLPVYVVYANIIIKELFPTKPLQVLYLFIPFILTFAVQFLGKGFIGFWEFLILNSLPLYLGLNLVFIIGLAYLIIDNSSGERFGIIIGKLIATIIIFFLIFTPPLHFFIMGVEAHSAGLYGNDEARSITMFVFTILLMAFFHYRIVIRLYRKGML